MAIVILAITGWLSALVFLGLYFWKRQEVSLLSRERRTEEDLRKSFEAAFRSHAMEALKGSSEHLLNLAGERLDKKTEDANSIFSAKVKVVEELLKPIRDTLGKVETDLRQVEKDRSLQFGILTQELSAVREASQALHFEAHSLSSALRRPEVRGSWGEFQLKRLVELAGMSEFCDFEMQVDVRAEDSRLRPDLVVRLPNKRSIVVDSKAVLDAYLKAFEVGKPEERIQFLQEHAKNIRARVRELSKKSYWDQFECPEFVVLYLPNEGFLNAALEVDRDVIEDAMIEKVVIATPTTLIALLKAVAYGWRQENLAQNAQSVLEMADELKKRLGDWLKYYSKTGEQLELALRTYNQSVGSFESRVLPGLRKMKEIGVDFEDQTQLTQTVEPLRRVVDETRFEAKI